MMHSLRCSSRRLFSTSARPLQHHLNDKSAHHSANHSHVHIDNQSIPQSSFQSLNEQLESIKAELSKRHRICVLSGAGISTESGIPDYRSPGRPPHNPITHQQFMRDAAIRKRYWARSMIGYHRMSAAQPNDGHRAIARASHKIPYIVTQNVDNLHERALNQVSDQHGKQSTDQSVVHLHGDISLVECTDCGILTSRSSLQKELEQRNPDYAEHVQSLIDQATRTFELEQKREARLREAGHVDAAAIVTRIVHGHDEDATDHNTPSLLRPDGDIEIAPKSNLRPDGDIELSSTAAAEYYQKFDVPPCIRCGGVLKPHVVFFGANVNQQIREAADQAINQCDALLIVGTSLTTWSAFRLVKAAIARTTHPDQLYNQQHLSTNRSANQNQLSASVNDREGIHSFHQSTSSPCFVTVINEGKTRADDLICHDLKVAGRTGHVLKTLLDDL